MNGRRALEIFEGFRQGQLAFDGPEIDELIKLDLVVDADPRDLVLLQQIEPAVKHAETTLGDPTAPEAVAAALAALEHKLKSSWSRLTTRDSKVQAQEAERKRLRRALAVLNDQVLCGRLIAMTLTPPVTPYYPCQPIGDEVYGLTAKGARVQGQLALRIDRYGAYPLAAFIKPFDKTEIKMTAFGGEIATLSNNIGYVKKNPHQVVIGLAKMGMPATEALGTYRSTMSAVHAPDVAVTYARNAAAHGGTQAVAEKLRVAQRALRQVGFEESPEVMGAAKTLLPYGSMTQAAERFKALFNGVAGISMRNGLFEIPLAVKCTARLMPADGTPDEIVQRVVHTVETLRRHPAKHIPQLGESMLATALASMVREVSAIEPLVERLRQVEAELIRAQVCDSITANANALECVTSPGTPVEVVSTVRSLAAEVATQSGRDHPSAADVSVAVSFAKRFAY